MRKSLLCFFVLLLLSASVLAASVTVMDDQKDAISVTQETLYGDPALVEDLIVTTTLHRNSQLFWDTSYGAGPDPQAAAEFRFYSRQQYRGPASDYGSFDLQINVNFGMGGNLDLEKIESGQGDNWQNHYEQMFLPAIDVASRTRPNETRSEILNLRDYYDYFRIGLNYHFPLPNLYYWEDSQRQVFEDINDYFRIPVPDELWLEVTVTKDSNGEVTEVDYWDVGYGPGAPELSDSDVPWTKMVTDSEGMELVYWDTSEAPVAEESYEPWTAYSQSVCTPEGVFFTLGGNADFSEIKGGYGLYFLPIGKHGENAYLDTANLENIYPLELGKVEDTSVQLSQDGTKLYLFTREAEDYYLTVLRCDDRTMAQRIPLGQLEEMPTVWMTENVVTLLSGSYETEEYTLQVFENRNGQLSLWLEAPMYPPNGKGYWHSGPELLFDGERLVIGCFHSNWNIASHRILLYDRSGLQYAGDYYSTADAIPDRLTTDDPGGMALQWTA